MNKKVIVYVIYDRDDGEIMAVMSDEDEALSDCMLTGATYTKTTMYIGDPQAFIESFRDNK